MKRSSPTIRIVQAVGLGGAVLLAACGRQDAPAPAPLPASSAANATAAAVAASARAPSSTVPPAAMPASSGTGTTSRPTPASSAPPPFSFDKLTLGDAVNESHEITHVTDHFAPGDNTLYASVATVGSSRDVTLNAKWSYLEGRGQLISNISQSIATDGPAITTFKLHNPNLWPEGKYKVEILIDGEPVASQDFLISRH